MDSELLDEFNSVLRSKDFDSINELSDSELSDIQVSIKNKFKVDVNRVWCWDSIGVQSKTVEYGEKDGLIEIKNFFGGDINVKIVVTDEETPPWFGFKGKLFDILDVLRNVRYTEFFLINDNCSWIIFDTHHNSLVFAEEE